MPHIATSNNKLIKDLYMVFVVPQENLNSFSHVIDEMGIPKKISCDNEFASNELKKYCVKNDIEMEFSEPNDIQKKIVL